MTFKAPRKKTVTLIDINEVSAIVGLTPDWIRKLTRQGKFPKRHSAIGRPRWSKLTVYHWLNRWGTRGERMRNKK
jgi:predicted DNA-binding transcriptional regulator AlpA